MSRAISSFEEDNHFYNEIDNICSPVICKHIHVNKERGIRMDPIVINAILKPKDGYKEELLEELQKVQAASQKEPGCIKFDLHQSIEDDTFFFYEVWRDAQAIEEHIQMEHYLAYREKISEIASSREIYKATIV